MFTIFMTVCFIFSVFDSQWFVLFGIFTDICMVALFLDYNVKVQQIKKDK